MYGCRPVIRARMEIGIIGLAQSGKSTLFEIMTGVKSREIFGEPFVKGVAKVPDARFDELVKIFKPAKSTPASIPFIDVCTTGEKPWDDMRRHMGGADGLVHIIDGFTSGDITEIVSKYRKLSDELMFSDLVVCDTRLERLTKMQKAAMKPDDTAHAQILPQLKEALENGRAIRDLNLKESDVHTLRGFSFWTIKPEIIVLNCREDNLSIVSEFEKEAKTTSPVISISCQIESEIAELGANERAEFLASLGIKEPAFEKIIQTAFKKIGRIYYFTVGEDEVRAWEIPTGVKAPRAAAAIHKDFERGFIKAEVASYDDFMKHGKTLEGAKGAGKLRLEGKEYVVQDGDIISFRFNV